MRPIPLALAACLIGLLLFPGAEAVRAEPPSQLPDLSVSPDDIISSYYGDPMEIAYPGLVISVDVTVRNAGPGNSTSANVTLFIDGAFVAIIHVMKNLTADSPGNVSEVHFTWDTTGAAPGNHTIRAVADDTAGDASPADNGAERSLLIISELPALTISMETWIQQVTVTPTDSGIAQFNGTVYADLGDWTEATVSLTSRVDVGWPASISPSELVLTSRDAQHFNVSVRVPEAWPSSTSGTLKVEGTMQTGGYTSRTTTQAIVTVKPYYKVRIESTEREKNITLGGEAVIAIKVWNQGSAQDSYNVAVENLDELRQAGWNVALENDMVPAVPRNDYRTLMVRIGAPRDWSIYEDNLALIKLNVSSINAADRGTDVSTNYTLTVRERGFNMPCVEAALAVTAVIIIAAAAVVFRKRGHKKEKTVKDYLKELNIDEGD